MRYLIYALILVNIAMLGWLYTYRDAYQAVLVMPIQMPDTLEPLLLLHERGASVSDTRHQAPVTAERESSSSSRPAEPMVESGVADNTPAAIPSSDLSAIPEAPAFVNDPSQPPADKAPGGVCLTIGPFADYQAATEFVAEVVDLVPRSTIRTTSVERPSGYWVYLPSMSHTQAQDIVRDLEQSAVRDYFLGRQNFISLGVFTDKRSAEARAAEISALGYAPRVEQRFLPREVYWVDIEGESADPIGADRWNVLSAKQPDIRRQTLTCE